jgi:ATP-binding cassette subfamily C protein LapB
LVVTHRPSLLRLVDRVIVVQEGRITADGPRDNVLGTEWQKAT